MAQLLSSRMAWKNFTLKHANMNRVALSLIKVNVGFIRSYKQGGGEMKRKFARMKDIREIYKTIEKLAKQVNEIARWQAYYAIQRNPNLYNGKMRDEILSHAKGHITYPLFLQMFKEYPLLEES